MKNRYSILVALLIATINWAQIPEKMSYQAILRSADDIPLDNQSIGMRLSILNDSPTGTAVYSETHTLMTNKNGLISLEIGTGTIVNGVFATIDWSLGTYFIQTETDLTGGTNYTITGTSQLLSVPYALHAKTVEEPIYTIGLNRDLGGYVFYVTPNGKHGLVAALRDQSDSITWYRANNVCSNSENHDSNGQQFTDWRLPTINELYMMFLKRSEIGAFDSFWYWSSTESTAEKALGFYFGGSGGSGDPNKAISYRVRCIRSF
ncbi:DUF1566 domain-containing protein [uncultured Aquimarina sp.]|uniref:Lcl domain-containing protein n=1 Tax=uncultured Aquimarina sp. TaxID=575652 RepID=UPI0026171A07|nr:DUF1566 domain-containing protein [uncultured Aquimarina sp.]